MLLVLNVLVVFWFNNLVLDGEFLTLGLRWANAKGGHKIRVADIEGEKMNKAEILYKMFPRRAECTVKIGGTGGGSDTHNAYCILAPNSLSQYVFLILWFWYLVLLVINGLNLIRNFLMVLRIGILRQAYLMRVVGSTKVNFMSNRFAIIRLIFLPGYSIHYHKFQCNFCVLVGK